MKTIALIATLTVALACPSFAQAPADTSPEKAAVIANDRAYEAAYAKSDLKTLADFFAADADYTTEDGRTFSGRAEIEEAIRSGLLANPGAKLAIAADSVRSLSSETVVEKGSTTVTAKSGEISSSIYTAIHVKKDGKWKISQLIESPMPVLTPRDHLAELAWLLGEWEDSDKTDDVSVRSQYAWARGGNFLARSITVKRGGKTTLEGWQVIGWDPVEERLRSWTFDGEGGFSEGRLTREGNRWLLRESGVAPDGSRTGADNTFTKLSADRFTWESNNRTLDGDPQPSIGRIEVNRVKGR
ncbi:MAG: nuclear transport factor 2 family protein [Chthoniobacter sp.]|nr:nuclear transport factor 2 family protein [Chthoniobacter sp.]